MSERLKANGEPYKTKWYKPRVGDKRKENGNNGTKRGSDKAARAKREVGNYGRVIHKEEVRAGLEARMQMVLEYYGNQYRFCKLTKTNPLEYREMIRIGMIPPRIAHRIQKHKVQSGCGFTARFCRPDLKFDNHGKPITRKCTNPYLTRKKTKEEAMIEKALKAKKEEAECANISEPNKED